MTGCRESLWGLLTNCKSFRMHFNFAKLLQAVYICSYDWLPTVECGWKGAFIFHISRIRAPCKTFNWSANYVSRVHYSPHTIYSRKRLPVNTLMHGLLARKPRHFDVTSCKVELAKFNINTEKSCWFSCQSQQPYSLFSA